MSDDNKIRTCRTCGTALHGRADQKFCSAACRNEWHNEERRSREVFIRQVNRSLKSNWALLTRLNRNGKTRVSREELVSRGFSFQYLTEIYTTRDGKVYRYCYDQGYLELGSGEYLLVKKQASGLE